MPGYQTRKFHLPIGTRQWKIRSLSDKQQYADPHGEALHAGICSAMTFSMSPIAPKCWRR